MANQNKNLVNNAEVNTAAPVGTEEVAEEKKSFLENHPNVKKAGKIVGGALLGVGAIALGFFMGKNSKSGSDPEDYEDDEYYDDTVDVEDENCDEE